MPGWNQFSFSPPLAAPCWFGAEYCLRNLPQGLNFPAAAVCQCPDSYGPRAGPAVRGERRPHPLPPRVSITTRTGEARALKGVR